MVMFDGYPRESGPTEVQNYVAVIPTSVTASPVVETIADWTAGNVRVTPHQKGTDLPEAAREQIKRTLSGVARNPNIVGLGCSPPT